MQNINSTGQISKAESFSLKGLAVLFMVLHHAWTAENYGVKSSILTPEAIYQIGLIGKMCVPIFVFITGYAGMLALTKKNYTYGEFIKPRLKGLWQKYFIYFVFLAICTLLASPSAFFERSWQSWLMDIFGVEYLLTGHLGLRGVFWYISTAYLLILIIPVLKSFLDHYNGASVMMAIIFAIVLPREYENNDLLITWIPVAMMGMYAYKNKILHVKRPNIANGLLICLVACCIYYILTDIGDHCLYIRYYICTPMFICGLGHLRSKVFEEIGKHSMGIFLIHTVFLTLFNDFTNDWLLLPLLALIVSYVIALTIDKLMVFANAKIKIEQKR